MEKWKQMSQEKITKSASPSHFKWEFKHFSRVVISLGSFKKKKRKKSIEQIL